MSGIQLKFAYLTKNEGNHNWMRQSTDGNTKMNHMVEISGKDFKSSKYFNNQVHTNFLETNEENKCNNRESNGKF